MPLSFTLLFRFDIEVESEVLALLLILLRADYFLESVAFFALILYLLIEEVTGFTGFLFLDDDGVEGIDEI